MEQLVVGGGFEVLSVNQVWDVVVRIIVVGGVDTLLRHAASHGLHLGLEVLYHLWTHLTYDAWQKGLKSHSFGVTGDDVGISANTSLDLRVGDAKRRDGDVRRGREDLFRGGKEKKVIGNW